MRKLETAKRANYKVETDEISFVTDFPAMIISDDLLRIRALANDNVEAD